MLDSKSLPTFQTALAEEGVDGWLLFDFRGLNPIAKDLLRIDGMQTRRAFAWIPTHGTPVAFIHAIEHGPWKHWPAEWQREIYSSWKSLEDLLARYVGKKRVAMEYSPRDAVPYLDRIPAGVIEMVRATGAEVVSSGELVSRFYAVWTEADIASHERAAEQIATIAREALAFAGRRAHAGHPIPEHELMRWILDQFRARGLSTDHGPNVSAAENAANPHYEPSPSHPREIRVGEILLIDLWAKEDGGIYADQTWMASVGAPSEEARRIWLAIRDARDRAISVVRQAAADNEMIRGAAVDDAARRVIEERGFGSYFTHRTGHSIDARDLHGSGPHLDNLETREERLLIPGVGFSIEPGIYVPGKIGMRTEVNVFLRPGEAVVTPKVYQADLIEV